MEDRSWSGAVAVRARIRGCLLGGAVGDALGNPVEFLSTDSIRAAHGPDGLRGLVAAGRGAPAGTVTDDTQMTLFTATRPRTTTPATSPRTACRRRSS